MFIYLEFQEGLDRVPLYYPIFFPNKFEDPDEYLLISCNEFQALLLFLRIHSEQNCQDHVARTRHVL